jgi:hypothetical protein
MGELRAAPFFGGPGYEAIRSWEGVEVQKVHAKVGRALLAGWYAKVAAGRAAGGFAGGGAEASAFADLKKAAASPTGVACDSPSVYGSM